MESTRCPSCGRLVHGGAECAFCTPQALSSTATLTIYPRSRDLTATSAGPSQQLIDLDKAASLAATASLVYAFSTMMRLSMGTQTKKKR